VSLGNDTFLFIVSDGTVISDEKTVSIQIGTANDLPVANAQDVTTSEDTSKPITLTADDIENEALTYVIISSPGNG